MRLCDTERAKKSWRLLTVVCDQSIGSSRDLPHTQNTEDWKCTWHFGWKCFFFSVCCLEEKYLCSSLESFASRLNMWLMTHQISNRRKRNDLTHTQISMSDMNDETQSRSFHRANSNDKNIDSRNWVIKACSFLWFCDVLKSCHQIYYVFRVQQ